MTSTNKTYDIILVYTQFRVHNYYINLIRQLSRHFSIGVYDIYSGSNARFTGKKKAKVTQTDEVFVGLCRKFGADILPTGKKYVCKLLLAPQHRYFTHELEFVCRTKTIALNRFGSGSLGLNELKEMGATTIWVYEKRIFLEALDFENSNHFKDEFEIIEMGAPYARYPALDFEGLNIDYLIAYPTPMFLKGRDTRCHLLENIITFVNSLPKGTKVCLKLHNVQDGGYSVGSGQRLNAINESLKKRLSSAALGILSCFPRVLEKSSLKGKFLTLRETALTSILEGKVISLCDLTNYFNIGLECFLPYVRKGIVTGISSCQWHSLYQRIPVYNCDDQPLSEDMPNYAIYKNFYVPPCHGKPEFNDAYFDKVSESSRKADLSELVKKEF